MMTVEERKAKVEELKAAREAANKAKEARKAEREAAKVEKKEAAIARGEKPAAKTKAKEEKVANPVWHTGEDGLPECVDGNLYKYQIECEECGESRWVTASQLHEVTKCKPCAKASRRKNRATKVKDRNKRYRNALKDALDQGLLPEWFLAKWELTGKALDEADADTDQDQDQDQDQE